MRTNQKRWGVLSLLLPVALGAGCGAAPSKPAGTDKGMQMPAAGTLVLHPERVQLQDGTMLDAERGMLFVPLERLRPTGPTVGIEFYRFRSTSTTAGPPIFRLPGGPGYQGFAALLANPGYADNEIRVWTDMGDYLMIGQRGIGSSPPNTLCERQAPAPLSAAVVEADETASVRAAMERCKAYWEGKGLALAGFSVVEAAADVDDIRRALGYPKIVLQGTSFGSHWAMAVMRYYPGVVERAVLSGMEGSDHTYDMPSGVLNAFARVAEEASRAPALARVMPRDGLLSAFRSAIARADAQPTFVKVDNPRTGEQDSVRFDAHRLRSLSYGYSGPASSRTGLASWPADIAALSAGRFDQAAASLVRREGGLTTASFMMLDCGSGISPARLAVIDADSAAAVLGDINRFYRQGCPVWSSDLGEEFRSGFDTDIPTVIVQGDWDTSTPIENALELAPRFKRHSFVTVGRGSHGALREAMRHSPDFTAALARFIQQGDTAGFPARVDLPPVEWVVP
ncbi:MAG: alpha/beta fold hydrolase [Gemmatimonadales bacterium]